MARASQFNTTEIALSRIADQQAPSADMRKFARQTINAHRALSDDLDGLASRRNVSLAWTPSPAGSRRGPAARPARLGHAPAERHRLALA